MSFEKVQDLYQQSTSGVRASFAADAERASQYYKPYVDFVISQLPQQSNEILDVGCGNGWSTWLLKNAGQNAHGLDLSPPPIEIMQIDPKIKYSQGDIQNLKFADNSFDVVAMHDVLEHIPNPEKALCEAVRILKPSGRLIIVGPNILSVASIMYFSCKTTFKNLMEGKFFERRKLETPRHPGGNTTFETWAAFYHHVWFTFKKLIFSRDPQFLMRVPDHRPPFHADNDSCYYANPMDILTWAKRRRDLKPLRWWSEHRFASRILWPFLGGIWVVIEKWPDYP